MVAYHFLWSLGHATDDYLFSDCQFFSLGNNFCPMFSKFPSSSIHIQFQYLAVAENLYKQSHLQTITDEAEPGSNGQWLDLTRPPGLGVSF